MTILCPVCYRPPLHDELLCGWISELAAENYPFRSRRTQSTIDQLFPFAKRPENRGEIHGVPVRTDFVRGLSDSVQRMRKYNYKIQDVAELLAYNTPILTAGIAMDRGTLARYTHAACSTVTGDFFDISANDLLIDSLRICPDCLKERCYLRTWHQLPGVSVCAEHGTALRDIDINVFRNSYTCIYGKEQSGKTVGSERELAYARYVKAVYDHPSYITLESVYRALKLTGELSPEKVKLFREHDVTFQALINTLLETYPDPHGFLHCVNRCTDQMPEPVEMASQAFGIGTFECRKCGKIWTDSIDAVRYGFTCPDCLRKTDPGTWFSGVLHAIGDGAYNLTGLFKGLGKKQEIFHRTCGKSRNILLSEQLFSRAACACEQCNTKTDIQEKIDAVTAGYTVLSYKPRLTTIAIRHDVCGRERIVYLQNFLEHPQCPECIREKRRTGREEKLNTFLGDEYEIVEGNAHSDWLKVRHKPCGCIIEGEPSSFGRTKRCPVCVSFYTAKRSNEPTYDAALLAEMREWFKGHRIWVACRHRAGEHDANYYKALKRLQKYGLIFSVERGMYSQRLNLSVYEILESKYLLDDDNERVGRFTGETSLYLAGELEAEPEEITLESKLLSSKKERTIFVKDRKVIVRGVSS